jgi:(R,R)-butanediol dehydrogenase/meso-butanediol dehydrogenase/diacetyl reductase
MPWEADPMKAAVFKAPGAPLVIEDVADPTPGPADLILKVRASGICGTDLHWSESRDHSAGWRVLAQGSVMGHEFAGEVVEVGRALRGQWRVGERVCAQPSIGCGRCTHCAAGRAYRCEEVATRASAALTGAYAEYTRVGGSATLRLPDGVSFQDGALVEPLAVGLNAVGKARLEPGDTVLIVGAGPVGIAVAMWCRFFGARQIVVSDLIGARAERAIEFGATGAIDASREDVPDRVAQLTGGQPRVVFDCVGVPGSLQLAIDYASFDAHVVVVGLCMAADRFFPAKAITKELDLTFVFVYRMRDFEIVVDMLGRERIDASGLVTSRVGFDTFCQSFEALKQPSDQIKVMLEPH